MGDSITNAVSNDQIADWARQLAPAKRKVDEANGVYRSLLKRAEADGIDTQAIIRAMKNKKKDIAEITTSLRNELRYMAVMRMEITASDIYNGWDTRVTDKTAHEDMVWDANDKGYKAGRAGAKIEDCEYPAGSELHVAWVKAWQDGQASIAMEMGEETTIANAAPRRPERKAQGHLADAKVENRQPEPAPADVAAADEPDQDLSAAGVEQQVRKQARKSGRKAPTEGIPGRKAASRTRTSSRLH